MRQNTCKICIKTRIVKDELSTKITENMEMSLKVWSEKKRRNLIGDPEEKEGRG